MFNNEIYFNICIIIKNNKRIQTIRSYFSYILFCFWIFWGGFIHSGRAYLWLMRSAVVMEIITTLTHWCFKWCFLLLEWLSSYLVYTLVAYMNAPLQFLQFVFTGQRRNQNITIYPVQNPINAHSGLFHSFLLMIWTLLILTTHSQWKVTPQILRS